jgi:hypothetical protein
MCPIVNGCEDTAAWNRRVLLRCEVYKEKVNTRDKLLALIVDGAALVKESQDDLRRTTRTITTRGAKCIEVGSGIFEQLQ